MYQTLRADQVEHYERVGALHPIPVLAPAELELYRRELAALEAELAGRVRRLDLSHLFFPWAYDLATHPRVVAVMQDLLGPDIFLHSTRIFAKHPDDPSYVSWHQDGLYSGLSSKPAPTAWIALTDSTVENGCVRVIPGSHLQDRAPHRETYAGDNLLNHGEEVVIEVDERQALDLELRAGEMSVHHVNMIHGSRPNRSRRSRIGFSMSFITPEVRRSALPVQRVSGERGDHELEVVERPAPMSLREAIARHDEFMACRGFRPTRVM